MTDERPSPSRARAWGRSFASGLVLTIALVLAPLSIITGWARVQLVDTDAFVAAYAPLAHDPAVQQSVTDATMTVIAQHVDYTAIAGQVIDGITSLGTGPLATRALDALKGPAAQGLESVVRTNVARFVASDAFATVFSTALRTTHAQLVKTMQGDPNALVSVASDGTIGLELGPVVAAVRQHLIDSQVPFAAQIPAVQRTIPIAQADALPTAQTGYAVAVAVGAWLPFAAAVLLVAGILLARRRHRAAVVAGLALALGTLILIIGRAVAASIVSAALAPQGISDAASAALFSVVTDGMVSVAAWTCAGGVLGAVAVWIAGPWRPARAIRAKVRTWTTRTSTA
ncbi:MULTISPECIES: hypothetical protein [Microbacterium]|uniref:hypothetical protein n=1 Tax=Microbacterium TaxID=33882 RepID=UPI0010F5EFE6|nr:hypothetical protein [Microbacterium sp. 4NA327F11]MCK9916692.1 hypothetical protein [Microbacteriaceae bacterium K1510]